MDNYEAWSEDRTYGLRLPLGLLQKILTLCKNAGDIETGGILVGYYNRSHDCAIVTDCSASPEDSQQGKYSFFRGIKGLQTWLNKLWHLGHRQYYLGEWHFHPSASPNPSDIDITQLKHNAENNSYNCPEPVILIVGGVQDAEYSCTSLVYLKGKGMIALLE